MVMKYRYGRRAYLFIALGFLLGFVSRCQAMRLSPGPIEALGHVLKDGTDPMFLCDHTSTLLGDIDALEKECRWQQKIQRKIQEEDPDVQPDAQPDAKSGIQENKQAIKPDTKRDEKPDAQDYKAPELTLAPESFAIIHGRLQAILLHTYVQLSYSLYLMVQKSTVLMFKQNIPLYLNFVRLLSSGLSLMELYLYVDLHRVTLLDRFTIHSALYGMYLKLCYLEQLHGDTIGPILPVPATWQHLLDVCLLNKTMLERNFMRLNERYSLDDFLVSFLPVAQQQVLRDLSGHKDVYKLYSGMCLWHSERLFFMPMVKDELFEPLFKELCG